jgi:RNA polymerase sigma-70 factor (ECF subfamily)
VVKDNADDILTGLFVRLATGDRTAIAPAFEILHPITRRFCEKMLGRSADADDATQQCLERVFEQLGTFDCSKRALPWVLTIAAWEVKSVRRRAWRTQQRTAQDGVEVLSETAEDPESNVISSQMLSMLGELVELLPDRDRETLRQLFERELTSGALAPADSTFRKRKERALTKLRALLRNLGHVQ